MTGITKLFLFSALAVASCNTTGDKKDTSTTIDSTRKDSTGLVATPVTNEALAGCYSQVYERDTSSLQVKIFNDSLIGPLIYKIFEKDRNDGMFKGMLKNDLLKGWYYFKSEGIMSVREVVWKVNSGQLWPAMGEMKIRNDTLIFTDPFKLKYDSTHPFVKINCVE